MALSRFLLLCMVASEVWDAETKPIDFVCNKGARRAMNIVAEMESALSPISLSLCSPPICLASVSSMCPPLQSDCNGSTTLSTPVQLPCTELHVASWENKSHQEKRGDIVASLRLLIEGVKVMRAPSQPGCGTSLLQRLENNINNHLLIITHLQLSRHYRFPLVGKYPGFSYICGSLEYLCPGSDDVMLCDLHAFLPQDKKKIAVHTFPQGPVVSPALSCVPRSTQSLSTVLLNYNRLISGKLDRLMVDLEDRCISQ